MLKDKLSKENVEFDSLDFNETDLNDENFDRNFSLLAELGIESITLRFGGFIGGLYLFLHFLQKSDSLTNTLFLFPAFIGLILAMFLGFSAWRGFTLIRIARRKRRDFYR